MEKKIWVERKGVEGGRHKRVVLTGADAAEAASRSPAAKLVHSALTEIAAAEWPGVRGREQTRLRNDRTRLRLINSFSLEKMSSRKRIWAN